VQPLHGRTIADVDLTKLDLNVILLVPGSLTTILFAIGSVEPERIRLRLKLSLAICFVTSVVAAVALLIGSRDLLIAANPNHTKVVKPTHTPDAAAARRYVHL
jgi:hypothetical protein